MTGARSLIKIGVGVVVVVGAGAWAYKTMYADKRAALVADLSDATGLNEQYEQAMDRLGPARRELQEHAKDAIGGKQDEAEHALRTALAALAAEAGVQNVTIASDQPRAVASPYINARGVNRAIRDLLKRQPDFAIIAAGINATGSLEQTLQLVALAQSQPWLHRVVQISLKPANQERTVFDINLRTQSLYMPDVHREPRALVLSPMDPLALDRITPIAMKNVFRYVPNAPAPPEPVVVRDDPPRPPPPPPYHQWQIVGMAMGSSGVSVMISNLETRQWRTLARGQSILGARFLDAQPQQGRAIFEIDGTLYEFFTNALMNERSAIPETDRPT